MLMVLSSCHKSLQEFTRFIWRMQASARVQTEIGFTVLWSLSTFTHCSLVAPSQVWTGISRVLQTINRSTSSISSLKTHNTRCTEVTICIYRVYRPNWMKKLRNNVSRRPNTCSGSVNIFCRLPSVQSSIISTVSLVRDYNRVTVVIVAYLLSAQCPWYGTTIELQ